MTPAYEIIANGERVTQLFAQRLRTLAIRDEAGGTSDTLTMEVEDSNIDLAAPGKGVKLEISIGYAGALKKMGTFIVDEFATIGPPDMLRISARAAPFSDSSGLYAMQSAKTRSWDASTLGTVAGKIAKEHGLTGAIASAAASLATPHLDQTAESDINFLSRVCNDNGLLVKVAYGRLIILKISDGENADGESIPTLTLTRDEVTRYEIRGMTRPDYTGVIARWHDVGTGKEQSTIAGSADTPFQIQKLCVDQVEARMLANATYARTQRQAGEFSLSMPGRTDILAEGTLVLNGFRAQYDGIKWRIEHVEHRLDGNKGYVTTASGSIAV